MIYPAGFRVSLVNETINIFDDIPLVFLFPVKDYPVPLAAVGGLNDKAFERGSEKTRSEAVENPKKRCQAFLETHNPDILPYRVPIGKPPEDAVIAEDLPVPPFSLAGEKVFSDPICSPGTSSRPRSVDRSKPGFESPCIRFIKPPFIPLGDIATDRFVTVESRCRVKSEFPKEDPAINVVKVHPNKIDP